MLSQRTRYALRSLLMLAEESSGGPVQIAQIADKQRVPRKFLELILLDLKKAGMVDSIRGRAGGYMLARGPDQITFGEVVRMFDGPLALVPCASKTAYASCGDCQDEATCAIRLAAIEVREEAARVLDGMTLARAKATETMP